MPKRRAQAALILSIETAVMSVLLAAIPAHAQASQEAVAAPRIQVESFRIQGNTLLPEVALQNTLAPFKGERTLAELKNAAAAVQALYAEQGYGGVIAYVPPQQGPAGEATIAVLEGRIAQVTVLGNARDSVEQVRRSLPKLQEGQTPRPAQLDAQVAQANQNGVRQLAVTLEPGAGRGDIDARIGVTELPLSRWSVGLDNTGTEQTGRLRANLFGQFANLTGHDDTLTLQAQLAPEHLSRVAVVSAGWRLPIYTAGLTLDLMAAYSDVDGGTTGTVAGPLQFSGRGEVLGAKLSSALPRLGEFTQRLSAGVDHRVYLNNCAITGLPAGACGTSGASVAVTPIQFEYQLQAPAQGARPALALSLSLSANLDPGGPHGAPADFQAVRPGADPSYKIVRVNGLMQFALPADWQLAVRGAGQGTSYGLVPGEQFGLGGANAVRGYEEREVTGDQALFGSIELMGPDFAQSFGQGKLDHLRLLAFFDGGRAWNNLGTACLGVSTRCSLASAGLGARLQASGWQLKLDLAEALKNGTLTKQHDVFLHVQLTYEFL